MARRRMTIKRIDPWSVLKFGFLANIVLLAIFMMVAGVVWFIVDRLQLVDQVCGIATDVGFTQCGVNAGNLFQSLILLGLLWVVVQTAVLVFFAFLYNLISDLTGGLGLTIIDDTVPGSAATSSSARQVATAGHQPGATTASATSGRTGASASRSSDGPPRRPDETRSQQTVPPTSSGSTRRDGGVSTSDDDLFGRR